MSRLIGLGLLLAGLLYPFAVYFGMEHFAPWQFGLLLGSLWLARALLGARRPGSLWMAITAIVFCLLLALFDSPLLLRWYPVLISAFMLGLFGLSLKYGPPMIERLARMREPQLPTKAIVYTRQVTIVWSVFFLCNGLLAAALTLWAPLSWWMLYTGLISYGLMGLLFAIEWLIRQRVRGHP
ncbi:COG4648 family protein [Pseudomonas sp. HLT2-19-2]